MTQFTPLLMTAAERECLLEELGAAGLHVPGTSSTPAPPMSKAAAPEPKAGDASWPGFLRRVRSSVGSTLKATL